MNTSDEIKNSPIVKLYGIEPQDAIEIEEYIESLIKNGAMRIDVLKAVMTKYKGKKLLYAVSFTEFRAGFSSAMKVISKQLIIPIIVEGDEA